MRRVLFICVHNAGRSQMAEALFNQLAKGKAGARSAGTQPGEALNPRVVQALAEVGIDISGQRPKTLTREILEGVERVITMGCGDECPVTGLPTEDWPLGDPRIMSLEEVSVLREEMRARVEKLIEEMGLG